jgi:hypothetical protein
MQSIRAFEFEARRTDAKVSCTGQAQRRTFNSRIMSALLVRETDLKRKSLTFLEPDLFKVSVTHLASFVLSCGQLKEPSKQLACFRRNALHFSEPTPCIWQVKAMQDGLAANTTHVPAIHAVRAGGGEGGDAVYTGTEGGNGLGSTFNREDAANVNRRHQRADSTGGRRASLAKSQDRGNDFESLTQTGRVGPMARDRGGISGVPGGAGSDSERSTADGGRRGPVIELRRVSICLALRPGRIVQLPTSTPLSCPRHPAQVAVLVSTTPSTGPPGPPLGLVREGPAGRAPAETRGSKPKGKQYKHYYATIPARRTWPKGHRYHGRSEEARRSGGERYHPDRRPQYSRTRIDRRRRFHAGRTPRPRWPHRRAPAPY